MVKPHNLARLRVPCNGGANLPGLQTVIPSPFKIDVGLPAVIGDLLPAVQVKAGLPAQTETLAEIADQHPSLLRKLPDDMRVKTLVHIADVGNRRFAFLLRRLRAEKPDFHGP